MVTFTYRDDFGGCLSNCGKSGGDGGIIAHFKKRKIRGGGGVLSEILSVVGVWIFSGTTQCKSCDFKTYFCSRWSKSWMFNSFELSDK